MTEIKLGVEYTNSEWYNKHNVTMDSISEIELDMTNAA